MKTAAAKVEPAKSFVASAAAKIAIGSVAAAPPDRRPAAAAQRQLQADIASSPQVQQAATLQRAIDGSPRQQAAPAPLQRKANKTGLPDELKAGVENLSGYSLDDVKVHYNSSKPAALQAHAYAQGTDIHVAPGQEKHLPHEAWHVVQQKQGRVRPTMQLKGKVAVNDDAGLEKEADVMGGKVAQQASPRRETVAQPRRAEETTNGQIQPKQLKRQVESASLCPSVLQRVSLNDIPLKEDIVYPNDNEQEVLTHMAGEWAGRAGNAVTGGHLLTAMKAKWGDAVANSVPNLHSAPGIHFAEAIPGDNITSHQHRFRLVRNTPSGTVISPQKDSTFWPKSWSTDALSDTLNNSFRNGNANQWASKKNTSYWYRWETLGANTLFPIEKVTAPTGTKRQKSKKPKE